MTSFPPPLPDPQSDAFAPSANAPVTSENRRLIRRTMLEALALFAVNIFFGVALVKLGWTFFLPSAQNTEGIAALAKNPLALLLLGVIIAPLWEELAFRGLPSLLLRRVRRARGQNVKTRNVETRDAWFWALAIVSSFAFAILHGFNDKGEIHLPLPQLLMGFFLWRAAVDRGLRFSILLHATYNGIAMLLVLLAGSALQETAPPPKIKAITVVQTATSSTRCRAANAKRASHRLALAHCFKLQLSARTVKSRVS